MRLSARELPADRGAGARGARAELERQARIGRPAEYEQRALSPPNLPDPCEDLAAVEPADRDEVREQERGVDREAELEQERVGFGQDGACEKGERQKRGRCETAERN